MRSISSTNHISAYSLHERMKATMKYSFVCTLLCVGFFGSWTSATVLPQTNDDKYWTYLVLAQFWPESSCIYFKEKEESCSIPPEVKGWTIHGLWPSRPDSTELPHDCDPTMKFDMDKIEALRHELDLKWHYYKDTPEHTYLWCHEWMKHGTCAYSLPDLRGELKYFNKTLELHSHLNLTEVLVKSEIFPSKDQTYKREQFFSAVFKYYKVKPFIVCDWDNKEKKAYIDQIYLCYNKSFELQDCYPTPSKMQIDRSGLETYYDPSYYEGCLEQDNIFYLPYNSNNRKRNNKRKDKSLFFRSEECE